MKQQQSLDEVASTHAGRRAGVAKPNWRQRHAAEIIRLAGLLGSLHTKCLEHSRQKVLLDLKAALLSEMCHLFEAATPVLSLIQRSELLASDQQGDSSSKASAATKIIDAYMDNISSPVPSTHPSRAELAKLYPNFSAGAGSGEAPAGCSWFSNQPAASTMGQGGHLALLEYGLVRAFGEPGFLEAFQHSPDMTLTCFHRSRGEPLRLKHLSGAAGYCT
jgi:hypothetical protein